MILSSKDFDNAKNENISSLKFLKQSIQDKKRALKNCIRIIKLILAKNRRKINQIAEIILEELLF